ncbi:MAG: ATP-dependent DNA helicase [Planctomycetota bacterium]
MTSSSSLDALLGPAGPVARALGSGGGGYEPRPEQQAMARAVAEALSSARHLVVEAGTGVGKSFAYLVPLLAAAVRDDLKVAVATSTIALQEQLVRRDLPLLASALPFEVSFALVKGRSNYVCLRRLGRALEDAATLFDGAGARAELQTIRAWAATSREGSRQDLPFRPSAGIWEQVCAERGNCLGRACAFFDPCAWQRSRQCAQGARCLVLNHHVLMADLAMRRAGGSFLPHLDAVVVDEAHDLEDTAAEHLGLRISSLGTAVTLGRLWQPKRRRGLLAGLAGLGGDALRHEVDGVRKLARRFFDALTAWLEEASGGGGLAPLGGGFPLENVLSPRLRDLAEAVDLLAEDFAKDEGRLEFQARARQVEAAAATLDGIVKPRPGEVRWVERAGRRGAALSSAPVDVGPLLARVLWSSHDSVILTSATLATGRPPSFAFFRGRLGLEDADELCVGSPFDYGEQARIRLAPSMPDPVRRPAEYLAALAPAVLEAIRHSQGGAFVLFTGYGAMRQTAAAVQDDLAREGIEILVQGEGLERPALLERFRRGGAVLFGVASFWQGVDVPGDALRHVVIARLPFDVPTHPLQIARRERIEKAGQDPFRQLSLPVAALRLKQGFGRLIRRRSDRGTVTILDPRIATRRYGRFLLEGLPACPVERIGESPPGRTPEGPKRDAVPQ